MKLDRVANFQYLLLVYFTGQESYHTFLDSYFAEYVWFRVLLSLYVLYKDNRSEITYFFNRS